MAAKKEGPTHVMVVYAEPRRKGVYRFRKRVLPVREVDAFVKDIQKRQQEFLKKANQQAG